MAKGRRIKWTLNSKTEINEILEFYKERNGNSRYSTFLKKEITDTLKLVAEQPMIGHPTEYPHIRQALVIPRYSVYYHHSDKLITVLLIWDNRRNPARLAYTLRHQDPLYLNEPMVPYYTKKELEAMPEELKERIDAALERTMGGKGVSDEDMKKRFAKWLNPTNEKE